MEGGLEEDWGARAEKDKRKREKKSARREEREKGREPPLCLLMRR